MNRFEIAALESDWQRLLDDEEAAFMRCTELDNRDPERTWEKSEAVREWWRIASAVIWMFVRTSAQHQYDLKPSPAFTLGRLANIAEELSNGNTPSFVADAAKSGRPLWRKERHHIAFGVLYIEAVRRGEIEDGSPIKTVRLAYNVTARAVQGWMQRREKICVGVPHRHTSPEDIRAKMLQCGEVYSRIGRGAPADN